MLTKPVPFPLGRWDIIHPAYYMKPMFDDIYLHDVPDVNDPFSPPCVNPWYKDYFLGDDY